MDRMKEPEFLEPDELLQLTAAKRASAQAAWLKCHKIPHRLDARRVIVSRFHVRGWLEGRIVAQSGGPNWNAVR